MGVPHDIINYAKRYGGSAEEDLKAILQVNINWVTLIVDLAGPYLLGFAFFVNTLLIALGFYYWMEMAQAMAVIILPATILSAISVKTVRKLASTELDMDQIYKILRFHRLKTQMFGVASISLAAVIWMYRIYLAFQW